MTHSFRRMLYYVSFWIAGMLPLFLLVGGCQSTEYPKGDIGVRTKMFVVEDGSIIPYNGVAKIAQLGTRMINAKGDWMVDYITCDRTVGEMSQVYYLPVSREVFRSAIRRAGGDPDRVVYVESSQ